MPGNRPGILALGAAVDDWPTEGSLFARRNNSTTQSAALAYELISQLSDTSSNSGVIHSIGLLPPFRICTISLDLSWVSSASGARSTVTPCQARSLLGRIWRKRERIEHIVANRLVHSRGVQVFVARSPEDHAIGDRRTASHRAARREGP